MPPEFRTIPPQHFDTICDLHQRQGIGARKISKTMKDVYGASFVSLILKDCGDPIARARRTGSTVTHVPIPVAEPAPPEVQVRTDPHVRRNIIRPRRSKSERSENPPQPLTFPSTDNPSIDLTDPVQSRGLSDEPNANNDNIKAVTATLPPTISLSYEPVDRGNPWFNTQPTLYGYAPPMQNFPLLPNFAESNDAQPFERFWPAQEDYFWRPFLPFLAAPEFAPEKLFNAMLEVQFRRAKAGIIEKVLHPPPPHRDPKVDEIIRKAEKFLAQNEVQQAPNALDKRNAIQSPDQTSTRRQKDMKQVEDQASHPQVEAERNNSNSQPCTCHSRSIIESRPTPEALLVEESTGAIIEERTEQGKKAQFSDPLTADIHTFPQTVGSHPADAKQPTATERTQPANTPANASAPAAIPGVVCLGVKLVENVTANPAETIPAAETKPLTKLVTPSHPGTQTSSLPESLSTKSSVNIGPGSQEVVGKLDHPAGQSPKVAIATTAPNPEVTLPSAKSSPSPEQQLSHTSSNNNDKDESETIPRLRVCPPSKALIGVQPATPCLAPIQPAQTSNETDTQVTAPNCQIEAANLKTGQSTGDTLVNLVLIAGAVYAGYRVIEPIVAPLLKKHFSKHKYTTASTMPMITNSTHLVPTTIDRCTAELYTVTPKSERIMVF